MTPPITPSQTVGPFFAIGLTWPDGPFVVEAGTSGAVWLRGRILDGAGDPVPDAMVETWQADPDGRFDHPDDPRGARGARGARGDFRAFGRCPTDDDGRWGILTLKPGAVPGPEGTVQAPHVNLSVFARGLLNHVVTRLYFADEAQANAADPVLGALDPSLRDTLLARPSDDGYVLDIRLRGEDETVFFAV